MHIVEVAFDFDDKKVSESIEKQVHKEVVDNITKEVKTLICKTNYYGKIDESDRTPLRNMVENNVKTIMENHKEQIIEIAANKLSDSLKRSKAVKEAVERVLEN